MANENTTLDHRRRFSPAKLVVAFGIVGALQTLCFDRQPSFWLHWILWIPLVWLATTDEVRPLVRFLAAWVCGTVFWAINVSWIAHSIGVYGGVALWLAGLLLLLLSLYMGLYWAAFASVGRFLVRRASQSRLVALLVPAGLAALWVLLEIAREWMLTGFPWSPLGESLVRTPGALESTAWIGVRGLSFVVLFVNAALTLWLVRLTGVRRTSLASGTTFRGGRYPGLGLVLAGTLGGVVLLLGGALVTADRLFQGPGEDQQEQEQSEALPLEVKVIQPNVPIGAPLAQALQNYARLLELSACERDELVVWPESAAFPRTWQQHSSLRRDIRDVLGEHCALLFNTAWLEEGREGVEYRNTALLISAAGAADETLLSDGALSAQSPEAQRYDKMHLVPFGEYVPLREVLPFVGQLARNVGEFAPGSEIKLLQWREASIALSICFEVLFPKEVAARARAGATVLATLTNDAWFGDTAGPHQHLVSARFRAAETRLPLLFAAATGVSAAMDGRGRVLSRVELNQSGVIAVDLRRDLQHSAAPTITPYARAPWVVDLVCVLVLALTSLFGRSAAEV